MEPTEPRIPIRLVHSLSIRRLCRQHSPARNGPVFEAKFMLPWALHRVSCYSSLPIYKKIQVR